MRIRCHTVVLVTHLACIVIDAWPVSKILEIVFNTRQEKSTEELQYGDDLGKNIAMDERRSFPGTLLAYYASNEPRIVREVKSTVVICLVQKHAIQTKPMVKRGTMTRIQLDLHETKKRA